MKVAPKIVSGLVVKIFTFWLVSTSSKFISQPKDFPIQFFALVLLFPANHPKHLVPF